MKYVLTFCLFFSVFSLIAQNNKTPTTITNYASLSFYSQLENPLPKEFVYVDHFNQYIDIPMEPNLMVFQEADMLSSTDALGTQWMGTSSTSKFQFMNREFESTQIYDLNGVLRQTSVSFSFRKKK